MSQSDPNEINRLIATFTDLQEQWARDPNAFDWSALEALARAGAEAYNEGRGPSFHSLAVDAMDHTEFHERFLSECVRAGFDPFKLVRGGSGPEELPVIDHGDLAEQANFNASSARIRAMLMELARPRFEPLAQDIERGKPPASLWLYRVAEACAESIPLDLLERISPEMARTHHEKAREVQRVDPVEGYLSTAEMIVDLRSDPYG